MLSLFRIPAALQFSRLCYTDTSRHSAYHPYIAAESRQSSRGVCAVFLYNHLLLCVRLVSLENAILFTSSIVFYHKDTYIHSAEPDRVFSSQPGYR